jgi:hypothetical protein
MLSIAKYSSLIQFERFMGHPRRRCRSTGRDMLPWLHKVCGRATYGHRRWGQRLDWCPTSDVATTLCRIVLLLHRMRWSPMPPLVGPSFLTPLLLVRRMATGRWYLHEDLLHTLTSHQPSTVWDSKVWSWYRQISEVHKRFCHFYFFMLCYLLPNQN